jgi:galactose mutarotase-like enzyme
VQTPSLKAKISATGLVSIYSKLENGNYRYTVSYRGDNHSQSLVVNLTVHPYI